MTSYYTVTRTTRCDTIAQKDGNAGGITQEGTQCQTKTRHAPSRRMGE